jgi:hypothetical protein
LGTEGEGSLQLGLTLSPGVEVDVLSYRITGVGISPREGSIDVRGDQEPSILLSGVPPGAYDVSATATSRDGHTTCTGTAAFTLFPGPTTSVVVRLECRPNTRTGGIAVETSFNHCPELELLMSRAMPTSSAWFVTASTRDIDSSSLTYAWTASDGSFATPTASTTVYHCDGSGTRQIRVAVSDGQCFTFAESSVTCPDLTSGDCTSCALTNCAADGPGCDSLSDPTRRALCDSLFACARRTNCAGQNNAACWCGTVDLTTCTTVAGAANGPCLAEELAAAESTDPGIIVTRFTDPAYASGAAHNRLLCEFELCPDLCPPR